MPRFESPTSPALNRLAIKRPQCVRPTGYLLKSELVDISSWAYDDNREFKLQSRNKPERTPVMCTLSRVSYTRVIGLPKVGCIHVRVCKHSLPSWIYLLPILFTIGDKPHSNVNQIVNIFINHIHVYKELKTFPHLDSVLNHLAKKRPTCQSNWPTGQPSKGQFADVKQCQD